MRHVVSVRHVTTVDGEGIVMDSCVAVGRRRARNRQILAWCACAAIPVARRSPGEQVTLVGRVALTG